MISCWNPALVDSSASNAYLCRVPTPAALLSEVNRSSPAPTQRPAPSSVQHVNFVPPPRHPVLLPPPQHPLVTHRRLTQTQTSPNILAHSLPSFIAPVTVQPSVVEPKRGSAISQAATHRLTRQSPSPSLTVIPPPPAPLPSAAFHRTSIQSAATARGSVVVVPQQQQQEGEGGGEGGASGEAHPRRESNAQNPSIRPDQHHVRGTSLLSVNSVGAIPQSPASLHVPPPPVTPAAVLVSSSSHPPLLPPFSPQIGSSTSLQPPMQQTRSSLGVLPAPAPVPSLAGGLVVPPSLYTLLVDPSAPAELDSVQGALLNRGKEWEHLARDLPSLLPSSGKHREGGRGGSSSSLPDGGESFKHLGADSSCHHFIERPLRPYLCDDSGMSELRQQNSKLDRQLQELQHVKTFAAEQQSFLRRQAADRQERLQRRLEGRFREFAYETAAQSKTGSPPRDLSPEEQHELARAELKDRPPSPYESRDLRTISKQFAALLDPPLPPSAPSASGSPLFEEDSIDRQQQTARRTPMSTFRSPSTIQQQTEGVPDPFNDDLWSYNYQPLLSPGRSPAIQILTSSRTPSPTPSPGRPPNQGGVSWGVGDITVTSSGDFTHTHSISIAPPPRPIFFNLPEVSPQSFESSRGWRQQTDLLTNGNATLTPDSLMTGPVDPTGAGVSSLGERPSPHSPLVAPNPPPLSTVEETDEDQEGSSRMTGRKQTNEGGRNGPVSIQAQKNGERRAISTSLRMAAERRARMEATLAEKAMVWAVSQMSAAGLKELKEGKKTDAAAALMVLECVAMLLGLTDLSAQSVKKFLGDCRGFDPRDVVRLEVGEVLVYPDAASKPPVGQGLNRSAEITLFQCWPPSAEIMSDTKALKKYKKKIQTMTEKKKGVAEFMDYNPVKGVWKFRVHHF
uniref:Peptidase S59 domain-containing protein n=1 Tax=Chromera velia CCMP2878 TaxID=1169474 RepID=A0A0G4GH69_9ALVE|eukprot:Cvel_4705.t1-p1 / transcript=Cvel_4705.t1 / gene=Cvel_4705 / organism=Chromera_velia_CCMP2878 / gene_product=Nuclear pore complex protein Nup98-Nup96, putative / transcript_product=Nuclear pore complex protein Nup98-Nup96, putative / location=Cvel_scaffold209:37611-47337(-) / protein_length=903 / sequence_SO=supercontig / SO=protein_coding / is_pseudo=false